MSDIETREPLIEPLPTINEYINVRFPILIIIALTIIAMILMFSPQVFGDIFSSNNSKFSTSNVIT